MHLSKVIRTVLAVMVLGCTVATTLYVWRTPLHSSYSEAPIGKLNLEHSGEKLQVRFVPPKKLSAITILFAHPMPGSGDFCAHPDIPLALRVRVSDLAGSSIRDDVVTWERMQWTSWHSGPSLLLDVNGWLGESLATDKEYDLSLSVDAPVSDVGEVEVYLHWMDPVFVWGRDEQELQLTKRWTEQP